MDFIISSFLAGIINDAFQWIDTLLLDTLDGMLYVERILTDSFALDAGVFTNLYKFLYIFACALVVLKFLFKGFQTYILWRDGDADSSPQDMLMGTLQAGVTMALFPYLYDVMAEVTVWLTDSIMGRLGLVGHGGLPDAPDLVAQGLFTMILLLIFLVMLLVLYIKLLRRGFELMILRLGVPIACLGLVDSDGGMWKGYIQTFFKTMFTTVIQLVLMSLALRVIASIGVKSLLLGIAIVSTAFATPVLMQQMLVPSNHGGGMTNKIYAVSNIARMIKH
ncbi:MAG: DUF6102 family protein [Oscillospiraceae bacterium]